MNIFIDQVNQELKEQKKRLTQSERALSHAPEGYLKCRVRKKGMAFYCCKTKNGKEKTVNITTNRPLIKRLFHKKINTLVLQRAEENINILEAVKKKYHPNSYTDIMKELPQSYRNTAKFLGAEDSINQITGKPVQHTYDPEVHVHETACGLLMRSKSEVIIANTLTKYEIPFDYEKRFPYLNSRGYYYEPDFTFCLPNGEKKIWEHLGLLKMEKYSIRTAEKLSFYQKHGFLIGKNLILTQDDEAGNCSSSFIDYIVQTQLLPYFPQGCR